MYKILCQGQKYYRLSGGFFISKILDCCYLLNLILYEYVILHIKPLVKYLKCVLILLFPIEATKSLFLQEHLICLQIATQNKRKLVDF